MKRVLLALMAVCGFMAGQAQVIDLSLVEYKVHTSGALDGHTTWRLYANMTNATDHLTTVYGLDGEPLNITTTGTFWQNNFGATTGWDENCALIPFFPDLDWDSFVAIGDTCQSQPSSGFTLQSSGQPWITDFGNGQSILMDDIIGGTWFTTPDQACTIPAAGQILLGQFTIETGEDIYGCINVQVFPNYAGPGSPSINQNNLCFGTISGTYGCTDVNALNYDAAATLDNGQCLLPCALTLDAQIATPPTCSNSTNGMINIDASGAQGLLRYTISTGPDNLTGVFNNLGNGTYTVEMEDEAFLNEGINPGGIYGYCILSTNINFNTPPIVMSVQSLTATSCFGVSDGCATFNASGGTGDLDFQIWNTSNQPLLDENNAVINLEDPTYCGIPGGSWKYHATDANGCTFNSNNFSINQPIGVFLVINSTTPVTCANSLNGVVSVSWAGGTGDVDYQIEGDNTIYENSPISGLAPGTYNLIGIDTNGCTDEIGFTITAPPAVVVSSTTVLTSCFGTTDGCVTGIGSGGDVGGAFTYSMDGITYASAATYCDLAAGDYTIYTKDEDGCIASSPFSIGSPAELMTTGTVNDVDCFGGSDGSITLSTTGGTPSYTYMLDGNTVNIIVSNLTMGDYTIAVEDSHGCTTEVTATVDEPTAVTATFSSTDVQCFDSGDGTVSIVGAGGTPGYTYLFDGSNNTTGNFNGVDPGDYTATVVDDNGCEVETGTITIDEPTEIVITVDGFTNETLPNANDGTISISVAGGTPGYTYEWQNDNNEVVSTSQDAQDLEPGSYTVCVTDNNGCTICLDQDIVIAVNVLEFGTDVQVSINPNPNFGEFTMNLSGLHGQHVAYNLTDARGRVVMSRDFGTLSAQKMEVFHMENTEAGVYFLQLQVGEYMNTIKVVKQ